jgi:hypothetical protein
MNGAERARINHCFFLVNFTGQFTQFFRESKHGANICVSAHLGIYDGKFVGFTF